MKSRQNAIGRQIRDVTASIRFRLTLWTIAILAIILLVFSVFVYYRQAEDLRVYAQTQLQLSMQQFVDLIRAGGILDPEGPHMSPSELAQRELALMQGGQMLALIGPNGQILQSIGGIQNNTIKASLQTFSTNNPNFQSVEFIANVTPSGTHESPKSYMFVVTPLLADRQVIGQIILARPIDPEGQLPRLAFTLGLSSLTVLAIVLIGGYWLAGQALAPVRTITRTARGISETDLHNRLHLGTHDELGELANTFDAMLDRLQAAFDRQRQFTADASHELRTPLTIVGLETDHALARHRSADEYERSLRVIKSENNYMAHLVSDLLTLARMDAGQTQVRLERLDLSDVALDVVERLVPLARRDKIEMTTGDLPEVCINGDPHLLTQMLTNLVENAIKYAGGPGKHVWVDTGFVENDDSYAWVKVSDDGPGIPPEDIPHLFDRFYRVDKARTRDGTANASAEEDTTEVGAEEKNPEGSGLGLSIVQWIAHAHTGQVQVSSTPGGGTTFEVRLPLSKEDPA